MAVPSRFDLALAAVLTASAEAELHTSYAFERVPQDGPGWAYALLVLSAGAALAWRRQHPFVVGPFVSAVLSGLALTLTWPNIYSPVVMHAVGIYTCVTQARRLRSAALPALAAAALIVPAGAVDPEDPYGSVATSIVMDVAVCGVAVVVRRQRQRADTASHERDLAEQRTKEIAASERARIARELHDVVAHGMSVVVLQARGGRRVIDDDPGKARQALDDIERVASDCLDEMRRLLGILRGNDAAPLAPQPKLQELEALVSQARASGADVDLHVEGLRRDLSPALELSVFRIAQEALTNSLKHAPGSHAKLEVVYGDSAVTVIATDDGPGGTPNGHGHGLIGMRERVDLFGGTFAVGTRPGGGFAVRAELPLEPAT